MPRVKGGYTTRRRRKAILKLAKGFFGSKRTLYKTANEQVMRSLSYAYRDRKQKKRAFRKLWITRINAACALNGIKYSRFVNGLKKAGITVNRKMLADLAIFDEKGFSALVADAKKGLAGDLKGTVAGNQHHIVNTKSHKVETKSEAKPEVKAEVKKAAPKAEAKPEVKAEAKAEAPKATDDLNALKVTELREMAKAKGITGISTMKKAELIEALSK